MNRGAQDYAGWALAGAGVLAALLLLPLGRDGGPAPLRVAFGWGAVLVPFALMGCGLALAFADRRGWRVRLVPVACAEAAFLAVLALSHGGPDPAPDLALAGKGGGLIGWALSFMLGEALGATLSNAVTVFIALAALVVLVLSLPRTWFSFVANGLTGREAFSPGMILPFAATWSRVILWFRGRFGSEDLSTPDAIPIVAGLSVSRAVKGVNPADYPDPAAEVSTRKAGSQPSRKRPVRTAPRADWLPPLDLLRLDGRAAAAPVAGFAGHSADSRQRAQIIKQTLAAFGVPVEVVSIKEGPTVTQFGIEPGEIVRELRNGEVVRRRVSVQSILRLQNDLALELAAERLRVEAPVPGRPFVGIEVPNTRKAAVSLRNVLESDAFAASRSPLAIALGRDVSGDPVVADLATMPHLLIAGSTGSGKSVCINAIICSLLMSNGPETVRLLLIDPKMVELPGYNGIPHLLGPVITNPAHASGALAWLMMQMDERYRLFANLGVRNIAEYNRKANRQRRLEVLPYLVLIVDELADLMMTAAADIERQVCRLAQMSRATGIHLVLATQRPSVDVITGLIKANFPARIAFAVTTQIDSRVVLDSPGAEKLLGRGDMLYMAPDSPKLARIQGCFVSDAEIDGLVDFWQSHRAEESPDDPEPAPWEGIMEQAEGRDELLEQALKLLANKTHVSTSLLQRQMRIGFPRAARLMDQLEDLGAVSPDEGGGRSREVLWRGDN